MDRITGDISGWVESINVDAKADEPIEMRISFKKDTPVNIARELLLRMREAAEDD